ncbi:DUF1127 domain-containing protein [Chthonobacter rhizosphaerae]|uniref:DUF1127 domain-containing protein n=1 Tax=Chthonobacter rhizosphaerae TaxID=2735553 RepID=UPI0015EF39A1|nr:DUF1127 domain-containing protein [Chthonobacter rhizosphaerae]
MTIIIDHRSSARRGSILGSIGRGLLSAGLWLVRIVSAEIDRRRTFALLEMDDRMLTDLGISRGDVHQALSSEAGEKPSQRLADLRAAQISARRAQIEEMRREARAAR